MKQLIKYLNNKKGSGIMTVMIAITFLTAFGSLALYITYTSMQVVASDRISKEVSYNANTCMEEIKAGLQDIVSDSLEQTYRDVMPVYVEHGGDVGEFFAQQYLQNVVNWETESGDKIFSVDISDNENGFYDTEALEALVKEDRGYTCEITGGLDDAKGRAEVLFTDEEEPKVNGIVLRDIKVTFIGKQGRKSSVTADIKIGVPNIGYLLTQYALGGIPEFVLIARGELDHSPTDGTDVAEFWGPTYVGKATLTGDAPMRTYSTFICKDELSVSGGNVATYKDNGKARFVGRASSKVWAGNISINGLSSVQLWGDTYVANDLLFNGNGSYANLGGTYYGFGNGLNSANQIDHTKSSSIISNTGGALISFSRNLSKLTLAGVSFITNGDRFENTTDLNDYMASITNNQDPPEDKANPSLRMGESISGKLNQKVYLAPYGSISYETPSEYEFKEGETARDTCRYFMNDTGTIIKFHKKYLDPTYEDDTDYFAGPKFIKFSADGTETEVAPEEYNPVTVWKTLDAGQSKAAMFTPVEFKYLYLDFKLNTLTVTGTTMKYADYGAAIKPIYQYDTTVGKIVVYFFTEFDTQAHANQFFIDYFEAMVSSENQSVRNEMKTYLAVEDWNSFIANTAGSFYTGVDDEGRLINPVTLSSADIDVIQSESVFIQEVFDNYCATLSNSVDEVALNLPESVRDPFCYYINWAKIYEEIGGNPPPKELTGGVQKPKTNDGNVWVFKAGDKSRAIITTRDSFTYNASSPYYADTNRIIVATGDVVINTNFKGLIFAAGKVIITDNATFESSPTEVVEAYKAMHDGDGPAVRDFFTVDIAAVYENSQSGSGDAWNVASLVTYENWSR